MLTELKTLSLACKYVFCGPVHTQRRDPMELNSEGLEMQK